MKKIAVFALLAVMSLGFFSFTTTEKAKVTATSAAFAPQKWERLGSRKVNLLADHDEIMVTARDGFFTKVKFVVRGADIYVRNVRIVFGNGESKNITINRKINQGTESRVIDLPGNKRIIRKVVMNYNKIPNFKGKAVVAVWGRH